VAEMVLAGKTNSDLVATINGQGGRAVGLSGKDADLLRARKRTESALDLGLVGEVERVNTEIVHTLIGAGFLPVIAPVGVGDGGQTYNLNADHVAGAVAAALDAEKLIMLTDVAGVLEHRDDPSSLITELRASRARALIESGRIDAGMVPKVEACLRAVESGTVRAHIIDGRLPHALIMEIFTDRGIGTMVTRE
jgi:acetylglutamate kinase